MSTLDARRILKDAVKWFRKVGLGRKEGQDLLEIVQNIWKI